MTKPDVMDTTPDPAVNVTVNNANAQDNGVIPVVPFNQQPSTGSSFEVFTRETPLAEKEKWFKTYWRPAAAWVYLFINLFDFFIAPMLTMILPKLIGYPYVPWQPLTIQNGGMFHLAFGAVLGVTAWGRTKERVSGVGSIDNG